MGGKRPHMNNKKRKELTGRGPVGKTAVAGMKDRDSNRVEVKVVRNTKSETMSRFILEHVEPGAKNYTDDTLAYRVLPNHETVKRSIVEYMRGKAHTNGIESFWSLLKRAHTEVFHKISLRHLDRYVREFDGKHNIREFGTLDQMRSVVRSLAGKSLPYRDLVSDNGVSSGARS